MKQKPIIGDLSSNAKKAKPFLICGVIAGPLFTLAWLLESVTRADYNLLRHPISSLSIGSYGWTQVTNFIFTGLLTLVFAIGVWRSMRVRSGSIKELSTQGYLGSPADFEYVEVQKNVDDYACRMSEAILRRIV